MKFKLSIKLDGVKTKLKLLLYTTLPVSNPLIGYFFLSFVKISENEVFP